MSGPYKVGPFDNRHPRQLAGSLGAAAGAAAAAAVETHTGDADDAHDASAISFTPTGTIAATNVQAAIAEVAAEAGGATDHGALTGLGDDDHPQYATNTEFDDHSARHESGGADAIKLDDLGTPDDNTDLNVSTSRHGLTPKLPNDATKYLDGMGAWSVPAGGGGGTSGYDLDTYSIDGTYGDDFTAASLSGSWTRRNFTSGAETYQLGKNATYMRIALTGRAIGDGYFRTAPGGDWTFAMAFTVHYDTSAEMFGIACVDSNGTGVGAGFYNNPNTLILIDITTYSSYGGSFSQETAFPLGNPWLNGSKRWIYLRKSGTNYFAAHSFDGEVWSQETAANSSSHTVDRVAFMWLPLSSLATTAVIDIDWFNKIA